jgi:hypothetical protein
LKPGQQLDYILDMKAKTPTHTVDLKRFVRTDKKHVSNSYFSTLKRALINEPQWFGSEKFLTFGTEHHKRALEPKEVITQLDKDDALCTEMATGFRADPRVKQILKGARTEVEYNKVYRGVWVKLFVDIDKAPEGYDLKGTSCQNEREFIKASRNYDYFRQAALYMAVCKFKAFTFIGQGKKITPHPLFFLPVMDFPIYLEEGREELHQLIDIHIQLRKHYEKR